MCNMQRGGVTIEGRGDFRGERLTTEGRGEYRGKV